MQPEGVEQFLRDIGLDPEDVCFLRSLLLSLSLFCPLSSTLTLRLSCLFARLQVAVIVLSWHFNAGTMCYYKKSEFTRGLVDLQFVSLLLSSPLTPRKTSQRRQRTTRRRDERVEKEPDNINAARAKKGGQRRESARKDSTSEGRTPGPLQVQGDL